MDERTAVGGGCIRVALARGGDHPPREVSGRPGGERLVLPLGEPQLAPIAVCPLEMASHELLVRGAGRRPSP